MQPGIYLSSRIGGVAGFLCKSFRELICHSHFALCFDSFSFNKIHEMGLQLLTKFHNLFTTK